MPQKVIVGMSGGVDSSVAAMALLAEGYEVSGLFMKNWDEDDGTEFCTAMEDLADAQSVCDKLGIELKTVNFAADYWDRVFEVFLSEYANGRTPNPDILCNQEIKFKAFLDYALALGADWIATGHYARVESGAGPVRLLKGLDANKDQTYFIYTLGQEQLSKTLFPVGAVEKPEVRKMAESRGLVTARKRDSTGICFIGERRFKTFLQQYLPAQPGDIETVEGKTVGRHEGLMYFTLGQRRGFGIGGVKGGVDAPWYVLAKDLSRNVLVVGQGHSHEWLLSDRLTAFNLFWVDGHAPERGVPLMAKTRYRQPDQACRIESLDATGCTVAFEVLQRGVTPGQSVVFYQGEACLGGGIIQSATRDGRTVGLI